MRNAKLATVQRDIEREFDLYQIKFSELEKAQEEYRNIQKRQDDLAIVMAYMNKLIDKKRKEIMDKVVSLVSYGLQSVFDDPTMKLVVNERLQRNQKFYTLAIEIDGVRTENWDSLSGGVRDISKFMLRVVFLVVSSKRKFICLDEPFRGVSIEYREKLGEFIRMLAHKLGVQFLIVSHQVEIDSAADSLWTIRKVDGEVNLFQLQPQT